VVIDVAARLMRTHRDFKHSRHVQKAYHAKKAVHQLDLDILNGEHNTAELLWLLELPFLN
jgi:hypothetical protein